MGLKLDRLDVRSGSTASCRPKGRPKVVMRGQVYARPKRKQSGAGSGAVSLEE